MRTVQILNSQTFQHAEISTDTVVYSGKDNLRKTNANIGPCENYPLNGKRKYINWYLNTLVLNTIYLR